MNPLKEPFRKRFAKKKKRSRKREERIFMKPGKDNREDRLNFVRYWAEYIKNHSDKEWSKQQNFLINSQIRNTRHFNKKT